jgi:lipid-A-disaccharide synthase
LLAETVRWIEAHRPRAVLLVDYPGFNLRLATRLRALGLSVKGGGKIKCLYYISPQIWAWKGKRRFAMARDLDALAVIFPFETACYSDTALPVAFVGHPFVAADYSLPIRHDPEGPVLLLPGSREQAVGRIFPVMLAGFRALGERRAIVLYPSGEIADVLRRYLRPEDDSKVLLEAIGGRAGPLATARPAVAPYLRNGGPSGPALPAIPAAAVLTSSGTMSMQCALAGIPGAVVYRANFLTYLLGRRLVRVPYLGIANLLLEKPMYPEYIQGNARPDALAAELRACLHDPSRQQATRVQADRLHAVLGQATSASAGCWIYRQLH